MVFFDMRVLRVICKNRNIMMLLLRDFNCQFDIRIRYTLAETSIFCIYLVLLPSILKRNMDMSLETLRKYNSIYLLQCNPIIVNCYTSTDTYLRPEPLPERVFRAKLRVTKGDAWTPELADQNSLRFQHKTRDYRERVNLVIRRSDLRESYEGSEVLALDG